MKYESYYDGISEEIKNMTREEKEKEIERIEKELEEKNKDR